MIKLGEFFTFKRGNATGISERQNSHDINSVRLISATGYNNGGDKFVIPKDGEKVYKNALAIGNNGSVGLGKVFFILISLLQLLMLLLCFLKISIN